MSVMISAILAQYCPETIPSACRYASQVSQRRIAIDDLKPKYLQFAEARIQTLRNRLEQKARLYEVSRQRQVNINEKATKWPQASSVRTMLETASKMIAEIAKHLEKSDPEIWTNLTLTTAMSCSSIRLINFIPMDPRKPQYFQVERLNENSGRDVFLHEVANTKFILPVENVEPDRVFCLSQETMNQTIGFLAGNDRLLTARALTCCLYDSDMKGVSLSFDDDASKTRLATYVWLKA